MFLSDYIRPLPKNTQNFCPTLIKQLLFPIPKKVRLGITDIFIVCDKKDGWCFGDFFIYDIWG